MMGKTLLVLLTAILTVSCVTGHQPPEPAVGREESGEMSIQTVDLSDDWIGSLKIPGQELEIVFHIEKAEDGSHLATFDIPSQGAYGIAFESVSVVTDMSGSTQSTTVVFAASFAGIEYEAKLSDSGEELAGSWRQGGGRFDLKLDRQEERSVKLNRPQEPKPPFPYREEEVVVHSAEGVSLAGTLTLPATGGPFPGIVLITGSGPQNRDEEIFGHKPFLVIADAFTRAGIAVLRYDDRGVGGSTGDIASSTSEDFAVDATAVFEYLKSRPEIDPEHVGLLGHSEGAMIAPAIAGRNDSVAFIVLLAGPGVPTVDLVLKQSEAIMKAAGASDEQVAATAEVNRRIYSAVLENEDNEIAAEIITGILKESGIAQEQLDAQIQSILSPWYRYFLSYDPRPVLESIACPVLALFGSLDLQVDARQNEEAMKKAFEIAPTTDFTVKTLPSLNHLFQTATTGAVEEYAVIEETIAPAALEIMTGWVVSTTQRP